MDKHASIVIFLAKVVLTIPTNALNALMATLNRETIALKVVNLVHISTLEAHRALIVVLAVKYVHPPAFAPLAMILN